MSRLINWLDKTLYPSYGGNWDDDRFRQAILKHIRPHMAILDLGAGAGIVKQMNFRGLVRRVSGIDPDPRVRQNPLLDEAHEGLADRLPFDDQSFNLVFCDNVLEHVEDPDAVFREVNRVLKPGGVFLAKTPNRMHYMSLTARLTPIAFHRYVNRLRGRAAQDTFPTRYRINSRKAINRCAKRNGLQVVTIKILEGRPEYLRFNAFTYVAGWLYERAVNSTELLAPFRIVLLAELRKPVAS